MWGRSQSSLLASGSVFSSMNRLEILTVQSKDSSDLTSLYQEAPSLASLLDQRMPNSVSSHLLMISMRKRTKFESPKMIYILPLNNKVLEHSTLY